MALPPIPFNLSSSTSSNFCCFSSLHSILLQPQNYFVNNFRAFTFSVSCSHQTVRIDTQQPQRVKVAVEVTKKKRKPRPSFNDQIRGKWSLKLSSEREKFPWQEPEQKEQEEHQGGEQEYTQNSSGSDFSEPTVDVKASVSDLVSFHFPTRAISAPWHYGSKTRNRQFNNLKPDIVQDDHEGAENDDEGAALERKEDKIERKLDNVNGISIGVLGRKKTAISGSQKGNFLKEKPSSDGGDDLNFDSSSVEENGLEHGRGDGKRRSNTKLAEKMLPEHELQRLRNIALRMLERFKVGVAGITQELVDSIHKKWREDEVVKLKFEGPLAANMRRTHEILESKTGGLVVWRSGSSVVLYRGMTYNLPCVQLYTKKIQTNINTQHQSKDIMSDATVRVREPVRTTEPFILDSAKYLKNLSEDELMELSNLNHLLDDLGPRFKDWPGCEPLPVDADLLPNVIPGYQPPLRLLPYGVRQCLKDNEMTIFRRQARKMPPHFALGRNRQLQGLAKAMVKLWEKSAIAKIAIKRGVENTRNERMAEELKKLTGGTLVSRNKEYIVLYRGNDFLPPFVTKALTERQNQTHLQQDEEEQARKTSSSLIGHDGKASPKPLLAGTLAETMAATSHWGKQSTNKDIEKMMRDSALSRHASLIRNLEKKLVLAKGKFKKAEKALEKVQGTLEPADLPSDLETITDEERFLFRKIGLSMKPYLLLGRRGVYSGTVENMHLHWKYRELVKIIVSGKSIAQVKHMAISLEAESGGVLICLDKTTKGYAIIMYRGKNYLRPRAMRPKNLLTRRQALARSIELQRREALKHHISDLEERIELLKSELE
ncbi:Chloroplastic group IIA intron splicing facilitator CRS1 [Quillaja saponaria]|uniref:Chloroplastic group IIA intron splicing facilitator CRS1 n=1 Tax=Quillaja saponaria TaxID=32244 RepID=A0AAD7VKU8_QUISA|nr:Chloroplastic group IIA intron splicing facilitator CRS1 [Quillaja saponaria]